MKRGDRASLGRERQAAQVSMCRFRVTASCDASGRFVKNAFCTSHIASNVSGYCDCSNPHQRRDKAFVEERIHPVGCGHAVFTCQSFCVTKGHVLAVEKAGDAPATVERIAARLLGPKAAATLFDSSVAANLTLHGRVLRMHAARGDVTLQRIERELVQPSRYRLSRLLSHHSFSRVVVDVGCNLGDFAIAAWQQDPSLKVLCLEPMPVTYVYLRWNLEANGVPLLSAARFAAPGQASGGVLPLQAAVTSDGRDVDIEYSPTLSGFGVTSASSSDGIIRQSNLQRIRGTNVRAFLPRRGQR